MRKRPSIASVYLVSVSCQCIASVYLVSVSHQCIASVPTFETPHHIRHFFTPRPSFTPHPSVFGGLETAPSAPSGVNVARGVARDVARDVARGVERMRQYEHLTGAGAPPLFYISHNLSVEMGDFTDNWNTLNALHSDNLKNLSHTTKNKLYVACTRARSNIYFISLSFLEKYKKE